MADGKDYIRLDFKTDGRFVSFPSDMLGTIAHLLPKTKFEITADVGGEKEVVSNVSAKNLPLEKSVRTVVILKDDARYEFLRSLLRNNGEVAKNIVVTEFVRTNSLGAAHDNHSASFTLESYVSRKADNEISLKGAAKTKFQDAKGSFAERFFGSKTGTVATIGAIVAGAGVLHFSALKEQQDAKEPKSTPLAEKIAEIVQEGEQKAGDRVAATSQENQR